MISVNYVLFQGQSILRILWQFTTTQNSHLTWSRRCRTLSLTCTSTGLESSRYKKMLISSNPKRLELKTTTVHRFLHLANTAENWPNQLATTHTKSPTRFSNLPCSISKPTWRKTKTCMKRPSLSCHKIVNLRLTYALYMTDSLRSAYKNMLQFAVTLSIDQIRYRCYQTCDPFCQSILLTTIPTVINN